MAETFGFGQIVRGAADGGELQPLRALVVEKSDLLIIGAADPSAGHDVGHRADVGVVDFVMRRRRNFLLFFRVAGDVTEHAVAAGDDFRSVAVGEQRRSAEAGAHIGALEHVRTGFVIAHVIDMHAGLEPVGLDHRNQRIGGQRNDVGAFERFLRRVHGDHFDVELLGHLGGDRLRGSLWSG